MKKLLFIFFVLFYACTKSKQNNPQNYVHLTQQQIWDSLGFVYENKYWISSEDMIEGYDTIIFHQNNTITEINKIGSSIVFSFSYIGIDTSIHLITEPNGIYSRQIYLMFYPITDTITNLWRLHDLMINDSCNEMSSNDSLYSFSCKNGELMFTNN